MPLCARRREKFGLNDVGFEPFVGVLAGTTSEVLIMKREVVEKAPEKIRMR